MLPTLIIQLNHSLLGINVEDILEIIPLPKLQKTPSPSEIVAGYLNYRSDLIPIIDLRSALGYSHKKHEIDDLIAILKNEQFFFGLILQDMIGIENLQEVVTPPNQPITRSTSFLKTLMFKGDVVFILNPLSLFNLETAVQDDQVIQEDDRMLEYSQSEEKIFSERAQLLSQPSPNVISNHKTPLLLSSMGNNYYGINPENLIELIPFKEFTPIPSSPAHLLGCLSFKGTTLPLIDLSQIIRNERGKIAKDSYILIYTFAKFKIALLIEAILDLIYIDVPKSFPLPQESSLNPFCEKVIYFDTHTIAILDIKKTLASIQMEKSYE